MKGNTKFKTCVLAARTYFPLMCEWFLSNVHVKVSFLFSFLPTQFSQVFLWPFIDPQQLYQSYAPHILCFGPLIEIWPSRFHQIGKHIRAQWHLDVCQIYIKTMYLVWDCYVQFCLICSNNCDSFTISCFQVFPIIELAKVSLFFIESAEQLWTVYMMISVQYE